MKSEKKSLALLGALLLAASTGSSPVLQSRASISSLHNKIFAASKDTLQAVKQKTKQQGSTDPVVQTNDPIDGSNEPTPMASW